MSARLLASKGAKVVVADLQEDKGNELADEIGGAFCKVDVTNTQDLINAIEMAKSMGPLRVLVNSAGIGWAHLPVTDYAAPGDAIMAEWRAAAGQAADILDAGGRVLAHCMGGCGRSGAALLGLMVEAGEDPLAALARLRQVRPCAVEGPGQFDLAAEGAAG